MPGQHFVAPNDLERILLLREQGARSPVIPASIPGQAGFVVQ